MLSDRQHLSLGRHYLRALLIPCSDLLKECPRLGLLILLLLEELLVVVVVVVVMLWATNCYTTPPRHTAWPPCDPSRPLWVWLLNNYNIITVIIILVVVLVKIVVSRQIT
jgi:hypothetical protein